MEITQYWVGSKPARPMTIDVRDSSGNDSQVLAYTQFRVRLYDPNNREVSLGNAVLERQPFTRSRFHLVWPTDTTLFTEPGDYLLQMELTAPGRRDFTTTHVIRVRELGRYE